MLGIRRLTFMCQRISAGVLALSALVLGPSGCAPGATRGYEIEPVGETVTIPLWVKTVERRDAKHVLRIYPQPYQEHFGTVLSCFMVEVDGKGYLPDSRKFTLLMDTGSCPNGNGYQLVQPWSPPSASAQIAQLKERSDRLQWSTPPERGLFQTKDDYELDLAKWKSDRDEERAQLSLLSQKVDYKEALAFERAPLSADKFQGALHFPWNPRACKMEVRYMGSESLLIFPFRQTRD